jgi:hypothetical protein
LEYPALPTLLPCRLGRDSLQKQVAPNSSPNAGGAPGGGNTLPATVGLFQPFPGKYWPVLSRGAHLQYSEAPGSAEAHLAINHDDGLCVANDTSMHGITFFLSEAFDGPPHAGHQAHLSQDLRTAFFFPAQQCESRHPTIGWNWMPGLSRPWGGTVRETISQARHFGQV